MHSGLSAFLHSYITDGRFRAALLLGLCLLSASVSAQYTVPCYPSDPYYPNCPGSGSSPPPTPTLSGDSFSDDGSYTMTAGSALNATSHEWQERVNGGSWVGAGSTTPGSVGGPSSKSFSGKATGVYDYRVRACGAGCSGYSNTRTVTVARAPGNPGISASATACGVLMVNWSPGSGYPSGHEKRYDLMESTDGGNSYHNVSGRINTTATSWSLGSYTENHAYKYRVRAYYTWSGYTSGKTGWINKTFTAPQCTPGQAGQPGLTRNEGTVEVSWAAPTSGGPIDNYQLQRRQRPVDTATWSAWNTVSSNAASPYSDTGRSPGYEYEYRVRAENDEIIGDQNGTWSTTQSVYVPYAPPELPNFNDTVSGYAGYNGVYTLNWSPGGGVVSGYEMQVSETGDWPGAAVALNNGQLSITYDQPANHTGTTKYYYYRIRAVNRDTESPWVELSVAVNYYPKPGAVVIFEQVDMATSAGDYILRWEPPLGDEEITHYRLDRLDSPAVEYPTIIHVSGQAEYTQSLSGGVSGQAHQHAIEACFQPAEPGAEEACSGYTGTLEVYIPYPVPNTPANLTGPDDSIDGSFQISWSPAIGGVLDHYELEETVNGSSNIINVGAVTEFSRSGANGHYEFRVRACSPDADGPLTPELACSPWSEKITFTVASVPAAPEPVLADALQFNIDTDVIDQTLSTQGEFNVSSGGQATYDVPILTAPAGGNFVPQLSLSYNSGGGNGLLGYGWSLNGLGGISRCRQTESQDKNAAPITWTAKDRFCLNGERLLVDSQYSYGAPGATYKTEIDNYAKITAVGGSAGHPSYFKVEHKNGITEFYGASTDSKYALASGKVLTWALSRREDSAGNRIVFHYLNDANGQRINRIDYAFDNTGGNPVANLQFTWETRSDPASGYMAGYVYRTGRRLKTIESNSDGQQLREYRLNYNEGSAQTNNDTLSRLTSIRECVDGRCLQPTQFEWELPAPALSELSGSGSFDGGVSDFRFSDINGDGLMDMAWLTRASLIPPWNEAWAPRTGRYALGRINADGSFGFTITPFADGNMSNGSTDGYEWQTLGLLADFNGDGRNGNAVPMSDGTWRLKSAPISLTGEFGLDMNADGLSDKLHWPDGKPWEGYHGASMAYLQKNPNANATSDQYYAWVTKPLHQYMPPGTPIPSAWDAEVGVGSGDYRNNLHLAPIQSFTGQVGDFNGDGRVDLIATVFARFINCENDFTDINGCSYAEGRQAIFTSHPSADGGIEFRYFSEAPNPFVAVKGQVADLNNDGLSDLLYIRYSETLGIFQWFFQLNNGQGFNAPVASNFPGWGDRNHAQRNSDLAVADWNGDGYSDLIWHGPDSRPPSDEDSNTPGKVKVRYWNPALNHFEDTDHVIKSSLDYGVIGFYKDDRADYGFFNYKRTSIQTMDMNGDGKPDLVITPNTQIGNAVVYLNTSGQQPENRITRIIKGSDFETGIQYEPITHSDHYSDINGVNGVTEETVCQATDIGQTCWQRQTAESTKNKFYSDINDPWSSLTNEHQSINPLQPVMPLIGPMYVVAEVITDAPAADDSVPRNIEADAEQRSSYYYEQARLQAAGRGFLGFKRFTEIDHASGLRTATDYRQDWPYTGMLLKSATYTLENHKLTETVNTWQLIQCDDAGTPITGCTNQLHANALNSGTRSLGAMQPFLRRIETLRYDLVNNGAQQGLLLSRETQQQRYDEFGNEIENTANTYRSEGTLLLSKHTLNTYSHTGSNYSTQQGRLVRMDVSSTDGTETLNRSSSFTYYSSGDAIGLLATETIEPDQPDYAVTTTHGYDAFGNRIQSTTTADGQTRSSRVQYDGFGRYIEKKYERFTAGERLISEVISRDRYGAPTEAHNYVDAGNYTINTSATTLFGIPYFSADSSGAFTLNVGARGVDGEGVCPYAHTVTHTRLHTAGGGESLVCLDIRDREIRKATRGFDGQWSVVDTEYDRLNRIVRVSEPYIPNTQTAYWTEHKNRDLLGRAQRIEHPEPGAVTTVVYSGFSTATTNPNNHTRTEIKNALGRMEQVIDPMDGVTRYTYDPRGNLKTMTDPADNTTEIDYDLQDRKIAMNDPDKGNWIYRYNRFNELICQRDAKGQVIRQSYDMRGRLTSREDYTGGDCDNPGGVLESNVTWSYDAAAYGLGKPDTVQDSVTGYEKQVGYDSLGRVRRTRTAFPGHNDQSGNHYERITYDEYGRVFQTFDAARNGENDLINGIRHVYQNGYRHKLVDAAHVNGESLETYYEVKTMDARGNATEAWYGNGVMQFSDHDPANGRITGLWASNGGLAPLQDLSLNWDMVGNLESRHETGLGAGTERRNLFEEFDYDAMNRLTLSVLSGDAGETQTVNYNAIGNITFKTGVGLYSYNSSGPGSIRPHAVIETDGIAYGYDDNGNQTGGNGRMITYTVSDLPKTITKGSHITEFWYGPDRTRFKRVDTGGGNKVTTLYLGSVEKIYNADGSIQWKRNIGGVALMTQTLNGSGGIQNSDTKYLFKDHLGTLSLITDNNGDVVEEYYFDAWGKRRHIDRPGGVIVNPSGIFTKPTTTRGYTGHEQLDEVGLVHMNGRIYDDTLSRFVQADPIIQDPYKTESLNRYSYVWNNPLNATDPSGFLKACDGGNYENSHACQVETKQEQDNHTKEKANQDRSSQSSKGDSGLRWRVTDRKAFNQHLENTGQTQKEFAGKMEQNGISKSSFGSRGATIGGAVMDSKGNVGIIPSSVQAQNPTQGSAAQAALGGDVDQDGGGGLLDTKTLTLLEAARQVKNAKDAASIVRMLSGAGAALALKGDSRNHQFIFHFTDEVGRKGIQKSRLILPNRDGFVFFTSTVYFDGDVMQSVLALDKVPSGYFVFDRGAVPGLTFWGIVDPANGQPGGGTEYLAPGPVSAEGAKWISIGD